MLAGPMILNILAGVFVLKMHRHMHRNIHQNNSYFCVTWESVDGWRYCNGEIMVKGGKSVQFRCKLVCCYLEVLRHYCNSHRLAVGKRQGGLTPYDCWPPQQLPKATYNKAEKSHQISVGRLCPLSQHAKQPQHITTPARVVNRAGACWDENPAGINTTGLCTGHDMY